MKRQTKAIAPYALGTALAALSGSAAAVDFELDDGTRVIWNTTVSLGMSKRTKGPADTLIGPHSDANTAGLGSDVTDDGNLNYRKGDTFSTILKAVSDVEIKRDNVGGLVRAKAWYDWTLLDRGVSHGNFPNGYDAGAALSDAGFERAARFKGMDLLDAYVYGRWQPAEHDLALRLGKQVVNWGESLFVQGVNQVNPIDVPAFRRPGAQVKEVLLPVEMAYGNLGLKEGLSVEGFYQLKWRPTAVDGCGTYFSGIDIGLDPSCGFTVNGLLPYFAAPGLPMRTALGPLASDNAFYRLGLSLDHLSNRTPDNRGQWGFALRSNAESLGTEFGLYHMNVHARLPSLSATVLNPADPRIVPRATALVGAGIPMALAGPLAALSTLGYQFEYPENTRVTGLSAATNLFGWSIGTELSHTRNLPVQLNVPDLFAAAAQGVGPLAVRAAAAGPGGLLRGYDLLDKTQFQVNALGLFGGILGATSSTVIGELAVSHANVPDPGTAGNPRYLRGAQWGFNSAPYAGAAACNASEAYNAAQVCSNEGYATRNAWGYRLFGQLAYNTPIGWTLLPSLYWAHDVKGYSVDGQFVEKRKQLSLALRGEYQKRYFAEASYTTWSNGATYDPGRDRDFYSLSVGMTF